MPTNRWSGLTKSELLYRPCFKAQMCRQRDQLRATAADRAMMHVHFMSKSMGRLFAVWREVGLMARLWRARDIVPFV